MLIYLHGFNSSPRSHKAQVLARCMVELGIGHRFACPALSHVPDKAIAVIEAEIARHRGEPVCFLGSSLGGFYATHLAEKHAAPAVLVNPAIDPHLGLRAFLGRQQNLHTGETYRLTEDHLRQWERLVVPTITPSRYLLLVETGDEVLDYRDAVERYRGARRVVIEGGDHTLQSFPEHISLILEFAGLAPSEPKSPGAGSEEISGRG